MGLIRRSHRRPVTSATARRILQALETMATSPSPIRNEGKLRKEEIDDEPVGFDMPKPTTMPRRGREEEEDKIDEERYDRNRKRKIPSQAGRWPINSSTITSCAKVCVLNFKAFYLRSASNIYVSPSPPLPLFLLIREK